MWVRRIQVSERVGMAGTEEGGGWGGRVSRPLWWTWLGSVQLRPWSYATVAASNALSQITAAAQLTECASAALLLYICSGALCSTYTLCVCEMCFYFSSQ